MSPYSADYYAALRGGSRRSAEVIVPIIRELVHPRSVVDVGCGAGSWLAVFRQHGIEDILGIDGAHVSRGSAVVEHIVPLSRMTKRWFRMRAYRQGQSDVMIQAEWVPPTWPALRRAAVLAAKSAVRALIASSRVDPCRVFEDELVFWQALGRTRQRLAWQHSPLAADARPAG